jgi:hypothetical protein
LLAARSHRYRILTYAYKINDRARSGSVEPERKATASLGYDYHFRALYCGNISSADGKIAACLEEDAGVVY